MTLKDATNTARRLLGMDVPSWKLEEILLACPKRHNCTLNPLHNAFRRGPVNFPLTGHFTQIPQGSQMSVMAMFRQLTITSLRNASAYKKLQCLCFPRFE